MFKRLKTYTINEEDIDKNILIDWVFNSHYWIEYYQGYYKCKWCDLFYASEMVINERLCMKNPAVKQLLEKNITDLTAKEMESG